MPARWCRSGLLTSTLLNLFVVPSVYLRFGHAQEARVRVTQSDPMARPPEPELVLT